MNTPIIGTKSMVVSPHYLASMAGNTILEKGGNAFDAAVAVSACLGVVYPHMTGIGGDMFWLTFNSRNQEVAAYNGSGRTGSAVNRGLYKNEEKIPFRGIKSAITVPGMVDSWVAILERYGTMSLQDVLQPAISYADKGFPITNDQVHFTEKNKEILLQHATTAAIYTKNGQVPKAGTRFIQSHLAKSLQVLAEKGRDAFYHGALAEEMVSYIQSEGGYLTRADFANHHGEWVEPISVQYRDYTIYQVPPNSQGFVGLMALNILENVDFSKIPLNSSAYYHILVEALKESFVYRNQYLTDPDFSHIPLEELLDKQFSKELFEKIENNSKSISSPPVGSDTAYAAVVDSEGNAVSFIGSLYHEFGSGLVAGETGILMQNRGSFFSLDANHVNTLEPNKRSFHTLMPALACQNGVPKIVYGTQGGEGQPQTQTVMITRMIDYGMNPQEAISQPRFVWGRTWGEECETLRLESRVGKQIIEKLSERGHDIEVVEAFDAAMGHANAILIDENHFLIGGVDPRSDGAAIGS